jgi:hypothetical protein
MFQKKFLIRLFALVSFLLWGAADFGLAQDSSKNSAGAFPPSELKKFEPFLGRYIAEVDWPSRNLKWEGSLELAYAVKGWYVESNLVKETAGPHRYWRLMIAWDIKEKKYRVWRFETNNPLPMLEGVVNFERNDEWYAEWQNFPQPDGKKITYFSRFKLKGKDELDIITETLDADGKRERLGIVTCKRKGKSGE